MSAPCSLSEQAQRAWSLPARLVSKLERNAGELSILAFGVHGIPFRSSARASDAGLFTDLRGERSFQLTNGSTQETVDLREILDLKELEALAFQSVATSITGYIVRV